MKAILLIASAVISCPAWAGDLWEVVSSSQAPDGSRIPFTEKICFPKDGVDPAKMLGSLGSCSFDQKTGSSAAMSFVMTCRTPGMPANLDSMKVAGDARLQGDRFDMRYSITIGGNQAIPGGDFKMTGSVDARKVGTCNER